MDTERKPAAPIRDELKIMYDLIGRKAFAMMGAFGTCYDNAKYQLQWQIQGSKVGTIRFIYEYGTDEYILKFYTYPKSQEPIIKEIDGVQAEDVHDIIKRETGLYLTL